LNQYKQLIFRISRSIVSTWVLAICSLLMLSFVVTAQDSIQENEAITLAVSPQILELSANPGDEIASTFRLTNGGDKNININVSAQNFIPQGEDGAVALTEETTGYSLAQWISVDPQTIEIEPKQTQVFSTVISVPESAEPGGHFGSLVFRTIPPEQEGTAALVSQEIAPVILVRISGDVDESAEVSSFRPTQNTWSNQNQIELETRIKNNGNVHFRPTGTIEIKNMFGRSVATIDLQERNVIPGATRRTITNWDQPGFRIGQYSAHLTAVYGADNEILTAETSFIVFPYQIILPIAGAVFILSVIIWKLRRRISLAIKVLRGKSIDN